MKRLDSRVVFNPHFSHLTVYYKLPLAFRRRLPGRERRCASGVSFFFFQAEDGIRDYKVTGVQTCALPISHQPASVAGSRQSKVTISTLSAIPSTLILRRCGPIGPAQESETSDLARRR